MCPVRASARAVSAPKPLDAPVMTMTCFMTRILSWWSDASIAPDIRGSASDDPAVEAQRLAVDPASVGPGEKGDGCGNVFGLAEPFERRELRQPVDELRRLAVQEQVGRRRPRRYGVDGDGAAAQLLGEDARHCLDGRLGGGV